MKRLFLNIIKLTMSGIVALIFLSVFCLVYSYSGIHVTNPSGATDYKWQSNQYKATMTEGNAWMKLDKNGFNNLNSNIDDIDILLMGSSHMEAINIKQEYNVSELLNKNLEYNVYNIGMSGHQLYNIVNNFDKALEYYHPKKYVVIEIDSIELDEKIMKSVINGDFSKITSHDSGIVFYMQKIPAIKRIYKQLQDWVNAETNNSDFSNTIQKSNNYDSILNEFLGIISKESSNNGVIPIIFYHPSEKLDKDGSVFYATDSEMLYSFKNACSNLNIVFLDMTPSFEKLYKEEHKLAHGFNNTHVGSGHLNIDGHRIISNEIVKIINEMEGR